MYKYILLVSPIHAHFQTQKKRKTTKQMNTIDEHFNFAINEQNKQLIQSRIKSDRDTNSYLLSRCYHKLTPAWLKKRQSAQRLFRTNSSCPRSQPIGKNVIKGNLNKHNKSTPVYVRGDPFICSNDDEVIRRKNTLCFDQRIGCTIDSPKQRAPRWTIFVAEI